jgi:hypothetical protein
MRNTTRIFLAIALSMPPLAGFAQQPTGKIEGSPPATAAAASPRATATGTASIPRDVAPQPGSPWFPGTKTGLDKVASDGVATKTVKAAPCYAAARETDGSTTCVGISSEPARKH